MSRRVALLGPRAAGKSSVGRLLARELGWVQHSADEHCFGHYRELPEVSEAELVLAREQEDATISDRNPRRYLDRLQSVVEREQGPACWWLLWERMRLHAALRCLAHAGPVIVDLGAGHARLREPEHRAALDDALSRCDLAIWLQPWPDARRAAGCLVTRFSALPAEIDLPALVQACEPSQRPRAVEMMFTEEHTSEAVAAELLARIQRLL